MYAYESSTPTQTNTRAAPYPHEYASTASPTTLLSYTVLIRYSREYRIPHYASSTPPAANTRGRDSSTPPPHHTSNARPPPATPRSPVAPRLIRRLRPRTAPSPPPLAALFRHGHFAESARLSPEPYPTAAARCIAAKGALDIHSCLKSYAHARCMALSRGARPALSRPRYPGRVCPGRCGPLGRHPAPDSQPGAGPGRGSTRALVPVPTSPAPRTSTHCGVRTAALPCPSNSSPSGPCPDDAPQLSSRAPL